MSNLAVLYLDLGLLSNELAVDALHGLFVLVQVHDDSARGVLGQLVNENDSSSEAVGVGQSAIGKVGYLVGRGRVAALEDNVSPGETAQSCHMKAGDPGIRNGRVTLDYFL